MKVNMNMKVNPDHYGKKISENNPNESNTDSQIKFYTIS